jgi:hypothetical protein
VASLPPAVQGHLQQRLDWDNGGVDKDLSEIADYMLNWDGILSVPLGLTERDIHDIKKIHHDSPSLQR